MSTDTYPPSVNIYVNACFAKCKNLIDADRVEIYLKLKLLRSLNDGSLFTKDWSKEPLPSIYSERLEIEQETEKKMSLEAEQKMTALTDQPPKYNASLFTPKNGFQHRSRTYHSRSRQSDLKMNVKGSKFGDVLEESFDFKEITWKIPNFLSLQGSLGFWVLSSPFAFASATWELRMYPFGQKQESDGYIDLVIRRLNSRISQHHLFCQFCLKTENGKEFEIYLNECFQKNHDEWVINKYLHRSKLMKMKKSIVSNGTLTVLCQIRTKKIAEINRFHETESNTSLSKSDNTVESKVSLNLSDNKILSDFKELFLKQEDCDVIIRVKGREFPAHRLILKARSAIFASTFRNDMKEKSTGIVDIEDCNPGTFSNFLNFLYSGVIENVTIENVFSLFTISDKYDVQDLRKKCLELIKENLSVDTFCDTVSLAVLHSETELLKLSTDFFAKNLQDIIVTVKWQVFLAENTTIGNELLIKVLAPNKCSK